MIHLGYASEVNEVNFLPFSNPPFASPFLIFFSPIRKMPAPHWPDQQFTAVTQFASRMQLGKKGRRQSKMQGLLYSKRCVSHVGH
ncbi:hypothetical protein T4B_10694 [Trichinella pseudospiralis]|uniref:Uncharacterized protein n=1 Tax=Trichinella pseudospiralis TaxID=6337 RepID=A0A0V1IFT4_TRIPS|nr:hypothetical protein T4B_10694 [Trichinella pseudospiralis]KRZ27602.1 hypothetical protein T4C_8482 [Trichinella pseudospiralis]